MQSIITGKQPNQFSNCDKTKKRAFNTQIIKAKDKTQFDHGVGGPSLRKSQRT